MNIRKQRKRTQERIRQNRAWDWSFEKFLRAVVNATNKMSKALEEAYVKERNERQLQQTGA
jgi:hypothetical protein